MTPADLTVGLHPDLQTKIAAVLLVMARAGHPMRICQGVRTTAEQQALYARGRTEKGPKVTNADGVRSKSRHQPQADGLGHAVDCCFLGPDPFDDDHNWTLYGDTAQDHGLVWGGAWSRFPDRPHVELPDTYRTELRA